MTEGLGNIRIGEFGLVRRLGQGGMGEVWEAEHVELGHRAALKILTKERAREDKYADAFRREIQAMARLEHPSIARIYDYGQVTSGGSDGERIFVPGAPYLVMELADGSLGKELGVEPNWRRTHVVLSGVLQALGHAHARGFVHRDIKPGNVLRVDGGTTTWKLTDFGIVHAVEGELEGDVSAGTPGYMAPEQFRGTWRDFGPPTDLYAVGCMAWELTTGRVPFDGDNLLAIAMAHIEEEPPAYEPIFAVPDGFEEWLRILLAKSTSRRYQRAADAIAALEAMAEPVTPETATPIDSVEVAFSSEVATTFAVTTSVATIDAAAFDSTTVDLPVVGGGEKEDGVGSVPVAEFPGHWSESRTSEDLRSTAELPMLNSRLFGLRSIPFVGRREERDFLWETMRDVASTASPRAIVVDGPSGSGKTRLATWLCETAEELGAAFHLQTSYERGADVSGRLAGMLSRHLHCGGLDGEGISARVEACMSRYGLEGTRVARNVSSMIRLFHGEEDGARLEADVENICVEFLRAATSSRPCIVLLDDVQWGDEPFRLVRAALEQTQSLPLLFVLTARSEVLGEDPKAARAVEAITGLDGVSRLELGPMTEVENRALIEELLSLESDLVDAVAERVAGNPLFAVQLVGDWIERGLLEHQLGKYVLRGDELPGLPDDLHEVWADRIERLLATRPDGDDPALTLAAILGRHVNATEWREIARSAGLDFGGDLLDVLVDLRLASWGREGWSFIHGMLRESIVRRARSDGTLGSMHRVAGRWLADVWEKRGGGGGLAARAGHHLEAGGLEEEAVEPLLAGALESFRASQAEESVRLATSAVNLVERQTPRHAEAILMLARAHWHAGQTEEGLALARQARAVAADVGAPEVEVDALLLLSEYSRTRGEVEDAERAAREALGRADDIGGRRQAEARKMLAEVFVYLGELDEARELFELALQHAEREEDGELVASALYGLGWVDEQEKRLDDAYRHLTRAYDEYMAVGHEPMAMAVLCSIADVDRERGDLVASERKCRRLVEYNHRSSIGTGAAGLNLAMTYLEMEDYDRAERWTRHVEEELSGRVRYHYELCLHLLWQVLAAKKEDWAMWDRSAERVRELWAPGGMVENDHAWLADIAGRAAVDAGETERARDVLGVARQMWSRLGRTLETDEIEAVLAQSACSTET